MGMEAEGLGGNFDEGVYAYVEEDGVTIVVD
jgi:hypothetical protein